MGIDRIGKKTPAPPSPPETTPGERSSGDATRFDVRPPATAAAQTPNVAPASTAFDRWRAGEVDLDGYLDLKVDEATTPLQGLSGLDLDAVRSALRERLAGDPMLAELVRTVTGELPQAPSDA